MALNIDTKFEGKLTFTFKNNMKNLGNFHLKASKFGLWWDSFIQSRKSISLKFTGELFTMKMKKDPKLEEELICFKIDMRTLMILTGALENLKNLHFIGLPLTKVYNA